MAQNRKLIPNLDDQNSKALNITVLQRIDPHIEEILLTATHVTFYEFNVERSQWSRKDVEGSLFVVKRNTQPRFQFIVMNRRNTENLVEDILGDFEYDVQVPYLLYRNAIQDVNGIWFYNAHDCEAVGNLFSRILNAYSKVPPKPKVTSTKKCEFEVLEAVHSLSVMEGSLEPPASSPRTSVSDGHDDPFANFFSASMNTSNVPNSIMRRQPYQFSTATSLASHSPGVAPFRGPTPETSPSMSSASATQLPLIDTLDSRSSDANPPTKLVKPSLFTISQSSSALMAQTSASMPFAPLCPLVIMQHPHGTPLLQPFPPPSPPLSLTPAPDYGPALTREGVRDAMLKLVQNDHFIEMVYREMLNAHYS